MQVAPQPPIGEGVLAGVPFGAKDIIETQGLATEYGSPLYAGRRGVFDATIVAELRSRGAVLLGKTRTTAFAYRTPGPTRNPRNPAHTPGGSSSGSAAAVAAGVVPIAIGTQTQGSVLRPAAFCGITGFKPTFGFLSMEGVLPLAPSLDTLGLFTHTPADMLALWEALDHDVEGPASDACGVPEPLPEVSPAMRTAFERALEALRRRGVAVEPLPIAGVLDRLSAASRTIMAFEAAKVHERRFDMYGDRLQDLGELVRKGREVTAERYHAALAEAERACAELASAYTVTPVILTPAATGAAPRGLGSTGDPRMNAPWTAAGVPAVAIPMPVHGALPLGLQLTAARGGDAMLLRTAVRVSEAFQGGLDG